MADASVIHALRSALDGAPGDDGIRRHLADLLVGEGRAAEALGLYGEALERSPGDADLIRAAALAARLAGDEAQAEALERRLTDGGGSPAPGAGTARVFLADVGGLANVKERLRTSFLAPAGDPELSAYYGKSLRGGLLLYGPPGCGKTYVARALARELGAQFHAVGIHDVLDMWLGESERKLHELFAAARRSTPSLLFLDELDALGRKRSMVHGAGRTVVNQLLTELDGIGSDNEGLFVLAATNHPWDVDAALRRPGRFDRMLLVPPPDAAGRAEILELHLRERPTASLSLTLLAQRLDGFSGADLALACESATELAMEEAMRTGRRIPIGQEHLERAAAQIRPSTGAWFEIARNVARFAGEGGEYDDLLAYLRAHGLA